MTKLIEGREANDEMKEVKALVKVAIAGCDTFREEYEHLQSLTQADEYKQDRLSTQFRWEQSKLDAYLASYLSDWKDNDYFASGESMGNFNRELFEINWTRQPPTETTYHPYSH